MVNMFQIVLDEHLRIDGLEHEIQEALDTVSFELGGIKGLLRLSGSVRKTIPRVMKKDAELDWAEIHRSLGHSGDHIRILLLDCSKDAYVADASYGVNINWHWINQRTSGSDALLAINTIVRHELGHHFCKGKRAWFSDPELDRLSVLRVMPGSVDTSPDWFGRLRKQMPEISRFFGIIIRMYFDDHPPPHFPCRLRGRSGGDRDSAHSGD